MLTFLKRFLARPPKRPKSAPPKYRIVQHSDWGFCAMVDEDHGKGWPADGPYWLPLKADGTDGPGGDTYRAAVWREKYWVPTEAAAGARVNLHATASGTETIWEGG